MILPLRLDYWRKKIKWKCLKSIQFITNFCNGYSETQFSFFIAWHKSSKRKSQKHNGRTTCEGLEFAAIVASARYWYWASVGQFHWKEPGRLLARSISFDWKRFGVIC